MSRAPSRVRCAPGSGGWRWPRRGLSSSTGWAIFPPALQMKLLRVLHDGTFERLGESVPRTSRARVIAATHIDLQAAVKGGRFREDLYYRLRVVPIRVPPLRERGEDIEPLAQAILARAGARNGRALHCSPDTLRTLLHHDWPGNICELENALEYAVAVCRGQTLLPEDLPRVRPADLSDGLWSQAGGPAPDERARRTPECRQDPARPTGRARRHREAAPCARGPPLESRGGGQDAGHQPNDALAPASRCRPDLGIARSSAANARSRACGVGLAQAFLEAPLAADAAFSRAPAPGFGIPSS